MGILSQFFLKIKYLLGRGKLQSLTFYIPSPPERKTGYREKQFDKLFYKFVNRGFKIVSLSTQCNTHPEHSGMWIILVLKATCPEADKLDLESFFNDEFKDTLDSNLETQQTSDLVFEIHEN